VAPVAGREFRTSLTPQGHYVRALRLLYPRTGLQPSTKDMKPATHHLRVIPADAPMHQEAAELLPLIELRLVGIELRRAGCRWRVTKPALSIASWVLISTMATFSKAPL
jgi:hypothetical protein